jgi:putative ABC transport system substrate-binding protein
MKRRPSRRIILAAATATVLGHGAARAQERNRTFRIGMLIRASPQVANQVAFFDELGKAGFVEGKNLIVDRRVVDWRVVGLHPEQTAESLVELMQLAPDVLVASAPPFIVAAQAATRTIPTLGIADDMLASGFVHSLARPGGNLTGISLLASELDGKRLEILMELVPASHYLAVLADLGAKGPAELEALRGAAAARGVALSIFPVRDPADIGSAVDAAQVAGATALNVLASPILHNNRKIILDRSAALRLPAIYQWPETAEEGGLAAYGPRFTKVNRQLARQLVKLLHGANPADIPVEQPTEFELVINLKIAKALGLTIPPSILLLADEVIE